MNHQQKLAIYSFIHSYDSVACMIVHIKPFSNSNEIWISLNLTKSRQHLNMNNSFQPGTNLLLLQIYQLDSIIAKINE